MATKHRLFSFVYDHEVVYGASGKQSYEWARQILGVTIKEKETKSNWGTYSLKYLCSVLCVMVWGELVFEWGSIEVGVCVGV